MVAFEIQQVEAAIIHGKNPYSWSRNPASVVSRQYETYVRKLLSAACSISTQYLLNYILCILR